MVNVATSARYIAMAAPERREWVPISSALNPSFVSPSVLTADRSFDSMVDEEIRASLLSTRIVLTVVEGSVLG